MKNRSPDMICREGVVESVSVDRVFVRIVQPSACEGCHARSACGSSGSSEAKGRIIEAFSTKTFSVGDSVTLQMKENMGRKAVFYAFVFPMICICLALPASWSLWGSEILSALSSLAILVVYYLSLHFAGPKLFSDFRFFAVPGSLGGSPS